MLFHGNNIIDYIDTALRANFAQRIFIVYAILENPSPLTENKNEQEQYTTYIAHEFEIHTSTYYRTH